MSILQTIIEYKKQELALVKHLKTVKLLEKSIYFDTKTVSLSSYLKRDDKVGIIAEIKRKSPSTGLINDKFNVEELSIGYMQAGASALSILTDNHFFGGKNEDLETARKFNYCPILRKDFIIDEYQIIEAKSIGADCILLIAACLLPKQCKKLAAFAKTLDLEVLLEVKSKEEIDLYINEYIDIIGVNNRNLNTFKTNTSNSIKLFEFLPKELVKISESGISNENQIEELKEVGFNGFLIGSFFMKHEEPNIILKSLVEKYKSLVL